MKLLIVLLCIVTSALADPLQTRPPWEVELVAAAPDIVHPSVVCTAPDGRIFVAEDPMDIREDTPPDALKGRIICFHPDGKRTVFAEGLHAVFGMQYLEGNLYVLHNPRLTVFRDATGVGHDILTHTLAEPWALGWNDHIPANFKLGMDGWFYLAVGDKGLHGCTGSDGRKVDLNGGGIVRFRPDGSGLEIFASGVRNILDVALDAEDEFFTYDNTDEHHWMGRLTHMVEAGFYGYPHDFIPRRPYTLWMMHDFGAGAACGTLANTDDALPPAFAGNLFLSDFGKRQVTRVRVEREGATFRMAQAEELFLNPPDDFRPVGLCWSADGRSILICDWQHRDGKENVSVGRLWKLTWRGDSNAAPRPAWWIPLAMGQTAEVKSADLIAALVHPARSVRLSAQRALAALGDNETHAGLIQLLNDNTKPAVARMHALWSLDMLDEAAGSRASVLALAEGNDAALASQALRQLSQRRVTAAAPVAMRALASNSPAVRLQAATLLGRLANESASEPLLAVLDGELDGVVRYALHTALRRIAEARPVVVNQIAAGLSSSSARLREGCELALREFYSERLVSLLGVLSTSEDAVTAEAALRLLAPLSLRAPNRPFQWWAYHPASTPAPPRTERWAGSDRVLSAIRDVVGDPRPALREKALMALGEAGDLAAIPLISSRLAQDDSLPVRAAALASLAKLSLEKASFAAVTLLEKATAPELRLPALNQLAAFPQAMATKSLHKILSSGTTMEKLIAIRALGLLTNTENTDALLLAAEDPALRDAASRALAAAPDLRSLPLFVENLANPEPAVQEAARKALARFGANALPEVVKHARILPPGIRGALREIFKDVPGARENPLFATLPISNAASYETFAITHQGDAWRGQIIFFGGSGVACVACHKLAGAGNHIGPDLTLAGKQFSRRELIESILYPSRVVRDGYRQTNMTMTDGRELTGLMRADNANGITLGDLSGQSIFIPRAEIAQHHHSSASLMPEGLHMALTHEQFADLVAFVESRKNDPSIEPAPLLPDGFVSIFNGVDLGGWRVTDQNRTHWTVKNRKLIHDGEGGDLWSEKAFRNFTLHLEWRWPDIPKMVELPTLDEEGYQTTRHERVLDAGDSGVFLRGLRKAQANLFCYPAGSGEFWDYRESLVGEARRAMVPKQRADAPIGDWNVMEITLSGNQVTVILNGVAVIRSTELPLLPEIGPIGFQHEHGRIEIRSIGIREN